ncbi:APC family permease [Streptomyces pristinaespiralis]|uniref:Amino acid transporter transmembrane protein n=2 Tax=Streptomyces pristinaespiralis TaxID=38300 RepID=B5HC05_STRE2|nr:APC family permease [Streptomyces pristinaespiralis]ALC21985.1 amino acid permease [Streptomyces pristinaespiralis]EDY64366.1 amino acid transporter transmembrane protein [Streptomyces pristinaespiralis ATCC 25486]QMU15357.1 APC family permease [Streptomyces pristinaespiralis]
MRSSSGRGLRPNVLGTFDTVVMAVAGSAPAYSVAATTAVLVATVGLAGPAALLYCAIPMLGIVLAFGRLGRIDVNAGAGYSWVGRTLHPFLGFLSGWALVVSTTIFMVAGSLPAGAMTLALFDPDLADDRFLATAVGAAWFLAMLLVVLGGARLTVRAQLILTGTELAILLFFVGAAVLHEGAATAFDWSWFGFSHFDGTAGFASGALIATFYYWGWDVTSNLSEETRDSRRTAGLAALVGVGIVFLLFEAVTVAVNVVLTSGEIQAAGANVPAVLGAAIWPGVGGKLMVLAVLLSTVATLETTLIQVTRSLFAMGRDRTMPAALGLVHRRWNTPWAAVTVVGVVALALFVASTALGSVADVVAAAVAAIGLQIAFYYGLAGIAAVVAYRRMLLVSVREFVLGGVWPLLGALFMLWIFFESLGGLSGASVSIGLGGLAAGLVPMVLYWRRGSAYYRPARLDAARAVSGDGAGDHGPHRGDYADKALATDF